MLPLSSQDLSSSATVSEKSVSVIHPFLLAIFPSLSLVADHIALFSINRTVLKIGAALFSIATFCFLFLKEALKNTQKAGALVSSLILLFATYGHVFDTLSQRFQKINHRQLLTLWASLGMLITRFILTTSRSLKPLTIFLNAVSGSLITLSLVHIFAHLFSRARQKKNHPSDHLQSLSLVELPSHPASPPPDIYYLIIDGHARADTLREQYGYDNNGFVSSLQEKGFYNASQSRCNYAMTMLELASSLNGNYLQTLVPDLIGSPQKNLHETQTIIEDNFSMRFLKNQGYKIVFLGSGFGITQKNRHADLDIQCGQVDEPAGRFIQSTLLRPIADRTRLIENDKRQRILRMFSEIEKLPYLPGPKFVFAHIPSPQWPFLFDAQGNATYYRQLAPELRKKAYLNQLNYIDKKIEQCIEQIIAHSARDPIIIVQSDHGPNFLFDSQHYAEPSPNPKILQEKMPILNLIHLPGHGKEALYSSISPVNTFRLIFNNYFGANLPLLQDHSYFSTLETPYLLTPVDP